MRSLFALCAFAAALAVATASEGHEDHSHEHEAKATPAPASDSHDHKDHSHEHATPAPPADSHDHDHANEPASERLLESFDADKNKVLSKAEFMKLFRSALGTDLRESHIACVGEVDEHTKKDGVSEGAELQYLLTNLALVKAYGVCEHTAAEVLDVLTDKSVEAVGGKHGDKMTHAALLHLYKAILLADAADAPADPHAGHAHVRDAAVLAEATPAPKAAPAHCKGFPGALAAVGVAAIEGAVLTTAVETMLAEKVEGCAYVESVEKECARPSDAERYGYTILSVVVLSLMSFLLIFVALPIMGLNHMLLSFLLAFAVGALVGDSFFHIVPLLMGVHGGETTAMEQWEVNARMAVVLVTVLVFFWVDAIARKVLMGRCDHESHNEPDAEKGEQKDDAETTKNDDRESVVNTKADTEAAAEAIQKGTEKKDWFQWTPLALVHKTAWVVCIADGVHNMTDGLSIGASFSRSTSLGLSTSIAVFFHEIPQEVADFAILLAAGLSPFQAMVFNGLSGATAIVAGIIAAAVGSESKDAEPWMLCVTLGSFIYLALAIVLQELLVEKHTASWVNILATSFGMICGALVMWIIAITEKHDECGHAH